MAIVQSMESFLCETAMAAGIIIRNGYGLETLGGRQKGPKQLVTHIDLASQEFIIGRILSRFPNACIKAEESGLDESDASTYFAVDPLDGTTNFVRRIPACGVIIAYVKDGIVQNVVFFNAILEELFYAELGCGVKLNGKSLLRRPVISRLDQALVACSPHTVGLLPGLYDDVDNVRVSGCSGWDLSALAAGCVDIAVQGLDPNGSLKPWDLAPVLLVTEMFGPGCVAQYDGEPYTFGDATMVAASSPELLADVIELINTET